MSSVENRIVSIKFDNQQFDQQVAQTLATLDKLTAKLTSIGSGHGFADINAAANSVNFSGMASGIDKIASKFDALGAIGFTAIQNITGGVLNFVKNFAQNDILGPIITGGRTRALEIQQAQFQFKGLGINVQEVMQNALDAVKGTAFGLGDAAKAAAQFGASGISAGADMTSALRAIAGTAALTGDSFNDMAVLFTQSAATGKVNNQDLQQFATRGFNAAAAFAKQQGITEAQVHQMATAGTLDFHTFAAAMDAAFGAHAKDANQTFQGSLDNLHAALSRLGAAFEGPALFQSRDLFNALTPAIDNATAALSPLIFTLLSIRGEAISGLINTINGLDFTKFTAAIPEVSRGIANIVNLLKQFGSIVKTAFQDIFPADIGLDFDKFALAFERITNAVKIGAPAAEKITSIFKGLFSILDIGIAIVKGVATVIGDIIKALAPAGGGLLNLGASTGDFLTKMDQLLVKGGAIQDFFDKLGRGAAAVVGFLSDLTQKVVSFFSAGIGRNAVSDGLDRVGSRLDEAKSGFDRVTSLWDKFLALFQGVGKVFSGVFDAIGNFFDQLKQKIENELKPADFNSALDAINVGLLGGITILLKNFFSGGVKFGFGGGVFTQIKSSLNGVTKSLQAMQAQLKAKSLLEIAAAMGILTASIVALSLINSADLAKALTAMVVGFGELGAMLLLLNKSVLNPTEAFKLSILSLGLIGLASAMVIFSAAIAILGKLDVGSLAKGLVGVGAGMLVLVAGTNAIDADAPGLITAGIAMGIIATSLVILAKAVAAFGTMSWSEIGKGLLGVGIGLAVIIVALNALPPEGAISGLGFIEVAVGLRILADSVQAFGKLQFGTMIKGILGITLAVIGVGAAVNLLPPDLPITAAGLILTAIALEGISDVVKRLGAIPFGEMVKGLAGLAATLLILGVALTVMDASVAGAASLLVAAFALEVLTDVLKKLGQLSIAQLATGLGAIAAVLLVIGGASILLSEAIPFILAMGVALIAVGAGFALFGVGAFLVATAITALAASGVAGAKAFVASIEIFLEAIPKIAGLAAGLVVSFIQQFLNAFPVLIKTISALLQQILDVIITNVPLIAQALQLIFTEGLLLIQNSFPLFVQTGIDALEALLTGLSTNAKDIVDAASTLIINFINAITANLPALVTSATGLIVAFLGELGNHAADMAAAAVTIIAQLLDGISKGLGNVVQAAANLITTFLTEIGNHVTDIVTTGSNVLLQILFGIALALGNIVGTVANIIITLITEIGKHALEIVTAGVDVISAFIFGLASNAVRLANAAAQALIQFLNGLDSAIRKYEPTIVALCIKIGLDIVAGIFFGVITSVDNNNIFNFIHGIGQRVVDAAGDVAGWVSKIGGKIIEGIWNGVKNGEGFLQQKFSQFGHDLLNFAGAPFGIHFSEPSESTVMAKMGLQIVKGFATGINKAEPLAESSMLHLSNTITDSFNPDTKSMNAILTDFAAGLGDINEFNPTITPVLDLSKVQEGAGNISGILGTSTISPTVSTNQAVVISAAAAAVASGEGTVGASGPTEVNFNQTINAPKALSTNDIYRNTKSQIILAKEELSIP